jgi:hypothetical protein
MVAHQSAQASIEDQDLRFEALISGAGRGPQYFTNPSRAAPAGDSGFKAVLQLSKIVQVAGYNIEIKLSKIKLLRTS